MFALLPTLAELQAALRDAAAQRASLEAHAAAQQAELRAELRRKQQVVVELGGALGAVQAHVSELGERVRTQCSTPQCSTPQCLPPQPPSQKPSQLPSPQRRKRAGHEQFVGISPGKAPAQAPQGGAAQTPESGTTHPGRKESPEDVARRIEETNRRLQASLASIGDPKTTPITLDRASAFQSAPRLLP